MAAASAPASPDAAVGTVPSIPLTLRDSMPLTPCTSAPCPVASDVQVRAGSGASDAGSVKPGAGEQPRQPRDPVRRGQPLEERQVEAVHGDHGDPDAGA